MLKTRPVASRTPVRLGVVVELMKPVTWFPPIWAFACGAVAASTPGDAMPWPRIVGGMILAGPLVCGASQALNDWCDREVDAINEPGRPIPSGRAPGAMGLYVAISAAAMALLWAAALSATIFVAAALALVCGWAYSAPPLRLKTDGILGPGVTGLAYEGLAWVTGALAVGGEMALARPMLSGFALLYSLGALGIMTLNDFKAIEGDRRMGYRSLPVRLGCRGAAIAALWIMLVPQVAVAATLLLRHQPWFATGVSAMIVGQAALAPRLLRDPEGEARWFSGTGVLLFVAGMLVSAFAIRASVG